MAPPRKHDSDVILDAARSLVLDQGPRAVTVAAIAAASSAPQGTLYHRFGNRDAILAAAWLRALSRFQARALAAAPPPGCTRRQAVDAAVDMAVATIAFARKHPQDARLLLVLRRDDLLDNPPTADFRDRLGELNRPLRAALERIASTLRGTDSRSVEWITRAVVDLPHATVRRYADRARLPTWLEQDIATATRLLVEHRMA